MSVYLGYDSITSAGVINTQSVRRSFHVFSGLHMYIQISTTSPSDKHHFSHSSDSGKALKPIWLCKKDGEDAGSIIAGPATFRDRICRSHNQGVAKGRAQESLGVLLEAFQVNSKLYSRFYMFYRVATFQTSPKSNLQEQHQVHWLQNDPNWIFLITTHYVSVSQAIPTKMIGGSTHISYQNYQSMTDFKK